MSLQDQAPSVHDHTSPTIHAPPPVYIRHSAHPADADILPSYPIPPSDLPDYSKDVKGHHPKEPITDDDVDELLNALPPYQYKAPIVTSSQMEMASEVVIERAGSRGKLPWILFGLTVVIVAIVGTAVFGLSRIPDNDDRTSTN